MKNFEMLNAEVIGVSGDTAKNHQVFKKAHQLNFTLLADTDGKIAELFGVPVSKGEKTVTKLIDGVDVELTRTATAKRWTFIIDRNGKVVHRDDRVRHRARDRRRRRHAVLPGRSLPRDLRGRASAPRSWRRERR